MRPVIGPASLTAILPIKEVEMRLTRIYFAKSAMPMIARRFVWRQAQLGSKVIIQAGVALIWS